MQTNNRQQMLTVLAIAGIALFAGDKLLLSPLIDAWKARSESIAHLRSQLTQGKSLLAREKGLRSKKWFFRPCGADPWRAYNEFVPPVGDWVMGDTRELTAGLFFAPFPFDVPGD